LKLNGLCFDFWHNFLVNHRYVFVKTTKLFNKLKKF
jgi:hypothetical protein